MVPPPRARRPAKMTNDLSPITIRAVEIAMQRAGFSIQRT